MAHNVKEAATSRLPDLRIRKTRAALREALLVLLEERPFDQITIREITARAGVGYASYFRHHPSKEALLSDVAEGEIANLIALSLPAFTATDTHTAALAFCRYVDEHRAIWTALLTGGAAGMVREEFVRQSRALPIGTDTPQPQPWLPSDLGIIYSVSATVELLAWWLPQRDAYSVEQVAGILDRLIMAPLAKR